jgi:hypothetical protein
MTLQLPLVQDEAVRYQFQRIQNPTAAQQKIYSKWLKQEGS